MRAPLLIIIVVFLAACNLESGPPRPTATTRPFPGEQTATAAAQFSTYTSATYGYRLTYPATWFVSETGGSVILSSFPLADIEASQTPATQTRIDIGAPSRVTISFDNFINNVLAQQPVLSVAERFTTQGGDPAVLLAAEGATSGATGIVYAQLREQVVPLLLYGSRTAGANVARTLRVSGG